MKEGHGKRHTYRTYWISVALAIFGYIGLAIQGKRPPTWDEVKPLILVCVFVFLTTLPFSAAVWIKLIGGFVSARFGKKETEGGEK